MRSGTTVTAAKTGLQAERVTSGVTSPSPVTVSTTEKCLPAAPAGICAPVTAITAAFVPLASSAISKCVARFGSPV